MHEIAVNVATAACAARPHAARRQRGARQERAPGSSYLVKVT